MSTDVRSVLLSQNRDYPPGRLADAKRGSTSDPGYPQSQTADARSGDPLTCKVTQEQP